MHVPYPTLSLFGLYRVAHRSEERDCNGVNDLRGGVLTGRDLGVDLSRYCNYYALIYLRAVVVVLGTLLPSTAVADGAILMMSSLMILSARSLRHELRYVHRLSRSMLQSTASDKGKTYKQPIPLQRWVIVETFQQVSNHCVGSVWCIGHQDQAGREKSTAVAMFV